MKVVAIIACFSVLATQGFAQLLSSTNNRNKNLIHNVGVEKTSEPASLSKQRSRQLLQNWPQRGSDIDGESPLDESGLGVSINDDGTIVAIGAAQNDGDAAQIGNNQGHVRVLEWKMGNWTQLGSDIDGVTGQSHSGLAVSLSGDGFTVAIGAPRFDTIERGRTKVFRYNGTEWNPYGQDIVGSNGFDLSGFAVSLSNNGTTLAVGEPGWNLTLGRVRVFDYDMNLETWQMVFDPLLKNAGNEEDLSGTSVSLSSLGDIIAIGAPQRDIGGQNAGHVSVYKRGAAAWMNKGSFIPGSEADEEFGTSVSLDGGGERFVSGAPKNYNQGPSGTLPLSDNGAVRVYEFSGGDWVQKGSQINGEVAKSLFGNSVSISHDGNRIVEGAPEWQTDSAMDNNRGRVKVYEFQGDWVLAASFPGEHIDDHNGISVSMSGDGNCVIMGAYWNDGLNETMLDAGHSRVFCEQIASGGGDPHFRSFTGEFFSFHGQCDMVLMKRNTPESDELGLDVHIRTTRIDDPRFSYSYISGIAVQLGDNVIEAMTDGGLVINGEDAKFSATKTLAGMTLKSSLKGKQKNIFVYDLILSDKNAIQIRANTKTGMLFIDCKGAFADSVGLLGSTAGMFGRDGVTNLVGHWNAWGEEWQVRDTEPKLFRDMKHEPQYPAGCLYEGASKRQTRLRRRLTDGMTPDGVSVAMANEACAEVISEELRNFCITDVLATGDIELAEDPFYV